MNIRIYSYKKNEMNEYPNIFVSKNNTNKYSNIFVAKNDTNEYPKIHIRKIIRTNVRIRKYSNIRI